MSAKKDVDEIHKDYGSWTSNAPRALRAQNWCSQAAIVGGSHDLLKPFAATLPDINTKAAEITGYKGNFALYVEVTPYANIAITQDGKPVEQTDEQKVTPARFLNLVVGEYKVVLTHPDYERVELTLKDVVAGKAYAISGWMKDRATIKSSVRE